MISNDLDIQLPAQQAFFRRVTKKPHMEHYKRLMLLTVIINIAFLIYGISYGKWWTPEGSNLPILSTLIISNFFIAILIRQHYVINALFWLATRAPTTWPLSLRWILGKVFHFGGIHSGCATSGTIWFVIFVYSATLNYSKSIPGVSFNTLITSYGIVVLLIGIVLTALPRFRAKYHNIFEKCHRFGGWTALLLFWTQAYFFHLDHYALNDDVAQNSLITTQSYAAQTSSFFTTFFSTPTVWMLSLITLSIVLPWLRLRRVSVEVVRPSSHAVLAKFNYGVTPFAGSSTAISRNPLMEWHSFANVPAPGESGFRLTISRAGDWTGKFIDDCPSHVWVKGIPTAGVANIEVLFKRVVYVATGSGIGPCLPHLLARKVPSLLVWSTRTPRTTYGDNLVDEIMEVQPNAVIWDTIERGKPDMVKLAYAAYVSFQAEAVICIANQKLTQQVVYGMESRGIPAYGAIWDS
ncbi:hypothetical protein [Marinibactrum halimedae]|uniref:Uncharacterized protein n=1 Tax=Marinibactrum halimedae TaxID=1444977 RepID=A0AA37WMQ2_9GAMM|nr:hypothetical protein [Marinibactrum halimedae]MCD9458509.1 hypothetical protein [Marinibactrum halimedae]GLS26628.1 hypothetical protein GCM10007877_23440 [Marinibactrum halimedae]